MSKVQTFIILTLTACNFQTIVIGAKIFIKEAINLIIEKNVWVYLCLDPSRRNLIGFELMVQKSFRAEPTIPLVWLG